MEGWYILIESNNNILQQYFSLKIFYIWIRDRQRNDLIHEEDGDNELQGPESSFKSSQESLPLLWKPKVHYAVQGDRF